jgi:hypothetical protein
MSSIVMTIHTFDHSYAGLSASEIQSSSCRHIFLSARRVGNMFINETGIRQLQTQKQNHSGKRYREMLQQTFPDNRDNSNFNLNEVIL